MNTQCRAFCTPACFLPALKLQLQLFTCLTSLLVCQSGQVVGCRARLLLNPFLPSHCRRTVRCAAYTTTPLGLRMPRGSSGAGRAACTATRSTTTPGLDRTSYQVGHYNNTYTYRRGKKGRAGAGRGAVFARSGVRGRLTRRPLTGGLLRVGSSSLSVHACTHACMYACVCGVAVVCCLKPTMHLHARVGM
jgi:hypothetical protein